MEVLTLTIREDLDVLDATFTPPDLTTFTRLDELGLVGDRAVLEAGAGRPGLPGRRAGPVVPGVRLRRAGA